MERQDISTKVDENRDKTFWFVDTNKYAIYPCKLNRNSSNDNLYKRWWCICNWSIYAKEDYLLIIIWCWNKIKLYKRYILKHLAPFLSLNILETFDELIYIEIKLMTLKVMKIEGIISGYVLVVFIEGIINKLRLYIWLSTNINYDFLI